MAQAAAVAGLSAARLGAAKKQDHRFRGTGGHSFYPFGVPGWHGPCGTGAMTDIFAWFVPSMILAAIILPQCFRLLREYERGVIFRLGQLLGAKGPGLIFLVPVVDRMVKMDLRVVTIDVAKEKVITRDRVRLSVDAVVYFRVVDPVAAVVKIENFWKAVSLIGQTTLRSVIGQFCVDDLLSQREAINEKLRGILDRQTECWGVKVTAAEVKDFEALTDIDRACAEGALAAADPYR